jgi:signal recognition particle receptor subunit beta
MESLKIVVIGPPHAGTTTFVRTASEIAVLCTERRVTGASGHDDLVSMDFGRITVSDDIAVYVFGIPARDEATFLWETLSEGALGVVILGDAGSETSLARVRELAETFTEKSDVPFVVALGHWQHTDADTMARVRSRISIADEVPLLVCNTRDRHTVKPVLLALMQRVRDTAPVPSGSEAS